MAWYHWSVIQTFLGVFLASTHSWSVVAHMPLWRLCRRLGGIGEGSLYPLVRVSRSTCNLWVWGFPKLRPRGRVIWGNTTQNLASSSGRFSEPWGFLSW